jgi:hypothetical protein
MKSAYKHLQSQYDSKYQTSLKLTTALQCIEMHYTVPQSIDIGLSISLLCV